MTMTTGRLRKVSAGLMTAALSLLVAGSVLLAQAQKPPAAAAPQTDAPPVPLARAVRFALGHGNADEARRLIQVSKDNAAKKAVATSLVAIYEGKDEDARHNRSDNPVIERSVRHPASMLALSITSLVLASAMVRTQT